MSEIYPLIGLTIAVIAIVVGLLSFVIKQSNKEKVPNPKLKEFEDEIKQRGFLLVDGTFSRTSIVISDLTEFLLYAKREGVHTIFMDFGAYGDSNIYFYQLNGAIVRTYSIKRMVKE